MGTLSESTLTDHPGTTGEHETSSAPVTATQAVAESQAASKCPFAKMAQVKTNQSVFPQKPAEFLEAGIKESETRIRLYTPAEVDAEDPATPLTPRERSALRAILDWTRTFITRPHPNLGR